MTDNDRRTIEQEARHREEVASLRAQLDEANGRIDDLIESRDALLETVANLKRALALIKGCTTANIPPSERFRLIGILRRDTVMDKIALAYAGYLGRVDA